MSVSEDVWLVVKGMPYVQEALEKGIVNHSALARIIQKQMDWASLPAIKVALIRIEKKLAKERRVLERKVLEIIKGSRLEVKNRVITITSKEKINMPCIASVKGPSGFLCIAETLPEGFKGRRLRIKRDMSIISIISPEKIEDTPTVVSFLLSILASENINVFEIMSFYRDTLIVVSEDDSARCMELLLRLMKR